MDATELRTLALILGTPEEAALDVQREAASDQPWLDESLAELETLPLERWQEEHTRLFIAGFPRTPCPPFASAWLEQRMHGTAMEKLLHFYRGLDLAPVDMPADYLGTILECAAVLAEAPDQGPLLEELWRQHLSPWLGRFTEALAGQSDLRIYRALARRLEEIRDAPMATAAAGTA